MDQRKDLYCWLFCLVLLCLPACKSTDPTLQPSGHAVTVPSDPHQPFSSYVVENRAKIAELVERLRFQSGKSPYIGSYSSKQVAEMRGPFQIPESDQDICWSKSQGGGKGFLLIHGLTDSPYLMRDIADSLHQAYPCALIRALLLPGHGTVAGDSLTMRYQDWLAVTDYGVGSFDEMKGITDLYIVGFSMGASLAIREFKEGGHTDKIKGLVLISAAVKAKTPFAGLTSLVEHFKDWAGVSAERDAARYESFAMHAGAEFYKLTKDLMNGEYGVNIPALMAVSADDATVDASAARDFFCDSVHADRRALIWYNSRFPEKNIAPPCKDIAQTEIGSIDKEYQGTPYRLANFSHLSLPVSPSNPHYGVNGAYRNCKSYEADPEAFAQCQQGSAQTIFGENDLADEKPKKELGYDYWRRGTFNPDYHRLAQSIVCFVDEGCNLKTVLTLSD